MEFRIGPSCKGRATYRFWYAVRHNDARGWAEEVIANELSKTRISY